MSNYPSARSFGLTVVRTRGAEENVLCPFHPDKKSSASYNRTKGLFTCYVCNLGLNAEQLTKRLGLTIATLEEWQQLAREPEDYELVEIRELIELGTPVYHPYFQQRGIRINTANIYNLHWNYNKPQSAVLPITDRDENVIGAVHRFEKPKEAGKRYQFVGETTPVWPMHQLRFCKEDKSLLVTEGGWSAMRIHSWYLGQSILPPICLALLGAKASEKIADLLRPFTSLFFLYDGDEAGRRACAKMRSLLPLAQSWVLPRSPDDMADEEIGRLISSLEKRGFTL